MVKAETVSAAAYVDATEMIAPFGKNTEMVVSYAAYSSGFLDIKKPALGGLVLGVALKFQA